MKAPPAPMPGLWRGGAALQLHTPVVTIDPKFAAYGVQLVA